MSDQPQHPYVNPYPHLHAGQVGPLHVDLHKVGGGHEQQPVKNNLGAFAIRSAVHGPPKP